MAAEREIGRVDSVRMGHMGVGGVGGSSDFSAAKLMGDKRYAGGHYGAGIKSSGSAMSPGLGYGGNE